MPLTPAEKEELRDYGLERACNKFRKGASCVQRNNSPMIGAMHARCVNAARMVGPVDKA